MKRSARVAPRQHRQRSITVPRCARGRRGGHLQAKSKRGNHSPPAVSPGLVYRTTAAFAASVRILAVSFYCIPGTWYDYIKKNETMIPTTDCCCTYVQTLHREQAHLYFLTDSISLRREKRELMMYRAQQPLPDRGQRAPLCCQGVAVEAFRNRPPSAPRGERAIACAGVIGI